MIKDLVRIGDTKYGLMYDSTDNETYMYQKIEGHIPKWSLFGYTRYRKILESINYIPINLSTLHIMFHTMTLKPLESDGELDDDMTDLPPYEQIDGNRNKKMRDDFIDKINDLDASDAIKLGIRVTHTPKNEVVKGLIKEGWHYFATQNHNSMRRSHYVYRTGLYGGYLHLLAIDEMGFSNRDGLTTNMSDMILPREYIDKVLDSFGFYDNIGDGK